jgi:hypothetical protein
VHAHSSPEIVGRTQGYTHVTNVWALCLVQLLSPAPRRVRRCMSKPLNKDRLFAAEGGTEEAEGCGGYHHLLHVV